MTPTSPIDAFSLDRYVNIALQTESQPTNFPPQYGHVLKCLKSQQARDGAFVTSSSLVEGTMSSVAGLRVSFKNVRSQRSQCLEIPGARIARKVRAQRTRFNNQSSGFFIYEETSEIPFPVDGNASMRARGKRIGATYRIDDPGHTRLGRDCRKECPRYIWSNFQPILHHAVSCFDQTEASLQHWLLSKFAG